MKDSLSSVILIPESLQYRQYSCRCLHEMSQIVWPQVWHVMHTLVPSLRAYSQQLCEYRGQCGSMVEEVRKALEFLQEMAERHLSVSQRTNALHQACEQLVQEQVGRVSVDGIMTLRAHTHTVLTQTLARTQSSQKHNTHAFTRIDPCHMHAHVDSYTYSKEFQSVFHAEPAQLFVLKTLYHIFCFASITLQVHVLCCSTCHVFTFECFHLMT